MRLLAAHRPKGANLLLIKILLNFKRSIYRCLTKIKFFKQPIYNFSHVLTALSTLAILERSCPPLTAQGLRGFRLTEAVNGRGFRLTEAVNGGCCPHSFLSFGNADDTTSSGVVDFVYLWTAAAMNAVVCGAVVAVVSCLQHIIAECCDLEMFPKPNPSQSR